MVSLEPNKKTQSVKISRNVKTKLSKTKRLEKELMEERDKANDYFSRLTYLQADFENFRKRTDKRVNEILQSSNERLIVNFLTIMDEFEMAIQAGKETKNKEALIKGIEMILNKLYVTLEHEGLTKIEPVGKPFDPKMHEIALKVPTKEHEEGVVLEEVRNGFMLRNKVIRPSIVKIATGVGEKS
jgi:molecular chaperone GrpE